MPDEIKNPTPSNKLQDISPLDAKTPQEAGNEALRVGFTLNGEPAVYIGNTSERLLDVLRGYFHLTGTKCGCKEGECGACAVILDGRLTNSCMVAMGRLDGATLMTIEGYSKTGRYEALSSAYAEVSAVQCGFCIPGMVLASECILAENPNPTEDEIRTGISGNLCRCTGYNAIVKAIGIAAKKCGGSSNIITHERLTDSDVNVSSHMINGCVATSLKEALEARKNSVYTPYAGGTDLMVEANVAKSYLFLHKVPELRRITEDGEFIRIGAAVTFSEIIKSDLTPGILKAACSKIAAPAIRNQGTVGGNIGNASAKADSALIFFVTDSKIRLMSADSERIIPIKELYLGRKKLALKPDELIVEVLMPKNGLDNYYYEKVGARNALAISRVSFAAILDVKDGIIANLATAFGAVSDVVIRRDDIDKMLIGKTIAQAKELRADYFKAFDEAIVPTRGRVSGEYRKDVCMNLLRDFLDSNGINRNS